MTEILPKPKTARVLQISPTETIIYDMSWSVYEMVCDILEWRAIERWPKSQRTVAKALELVKTVSDRLGWDAMKDVTVNREPTKQEIKGLSAGVWYDEVGFYKEDET